MMGVATKRSLRILAIGSEWRCKSFVMAWGARWCTLMGVAAKRSLGILDMGGNCFVSCSLVMGTVVRWALLHGVGDAVPIPHGGCRGEVPRVLMARMCLWRAAHDQYGGGDGDFTASVAEHGRWGKRGAALCMTSLGFTAEVPMALLDLLRAARGRYGGGDGDFTADVAEHGRWGGRGAVWRMTSLGVAAEVPMVLMSLGVSEVEGVLGFAVR